MPMRTRTRLGLLAQLLEADLVGDADLEVTRIGPLESADRTTIGFLANPRYQSQLATTQAGCVIVAPALRDAAVARGATLIHPDPYLAFARLTQWWAAQTRRAPLQGVHASAVVEEGARIDAAASVGAFAFIGRGARICAGAVIGSHAHIGEDAAVGAGTWLKPHVTLSDACRIGARGIVHSGAVIGQTALALHHTKGAGRRSNNWAA